MKKIFQDVISSYSKFVWKFGALNSSRESNESVGSVKKFTLANYKKDVVETSKTKPVMVYLGADWCDGCVEKFPEVKKLAKKMGNKASIGKFDINKKNTIIMKKYGIEGIPAVLVYRHGKMIQKFTDDLNMSKIESTLRQNK